MDQEAYDGNTPKGELKINPDHKMSTKIFQNRHLSYIVFRLCQEKIWKTE